MFHRRRGPAGSATARRIATLATGVILAGAAVATLAPTSASATLLPSVNGRVWLDANSDGIEQSSELPLANAGAHLLDYYGREAKDIFGRTLGRVVTKSDGTYAFTNLRLGTYFVEFDAPCTYKATVSGKDSKATFHHQTGSTCYARTGLYLLYLGRTLRLDYGLIPPPPPPPPPPSGGTISGRAFTDANNDGVRATTDAGIQFVGVSLTKPDGTPALTASGATVTRVFTGADGTYSFANVAAGSYVVTFDADCIFQVTTANVGTDDAVDSDATAAGAGTGDTAGRCLYKTGTITLAAGATVANNDVGFKGSVTPPAGGTVSGLVFTDANNDGIRATTDLGVQFVGVSITKPDGTAALTNAGAPIDRVFTAANGSYSFANVAAGSYVVTFDLDCSFSATAANVGSNDAIDSDATAAGTGTGATAGRCLFKTGTITVTSGGTSANNDLGLRATTPGTISGLAWQDANKDGLRAATGEPGLQFAHVCLLDASGAAVASVACVFTGADGSYTLSGIVPGAYQVEVDVDSVAFSFSPANVGTDDTVDSDMVVNRTAAGRIFGRAAVSVSAGATTSHVDAGITSNA